MTARQVRAVEATMLASPSGKLLLKPSGEYALRVMADISGKTSAELLAEGYRIVTVTITPETKP